MTIKQYLLGEITGEEQLREIEESLFADEDYYEELLRAEAELAEEYARGGLTAGERQKVEELYLSSPERRRGINFALVVEEYFNRRRGEKGSDVPSGDKENPGEQHPRTNNVRKFPGFKRLFFSTSFKIAASVILVFALGAGVWRTFVYRSDLDRGMVALKEAYREQRPIRARISSLDYAPPPNERGGSVRVNGEAKRRAERFLQYAVEDAPSAASYHAFGDQLLAAGQFDEALKQFAQAAELDPNNARLQNDMGVALLEKAGGSGTDADSGKGLADAGASLTHFDKALELDDSLLDALFNRALALERLKAFEQAQEAWAKYLERDSRSGWAEEARGHLERLKARRQGETSQTKEQVLKEFLEAHGRRDHDRAWRAFSRNREAITGKLISAQLVDAYLDASAKGRAEEARDALHALRYAGELETGHTGDTYTAELARFYGLSPPGRLAALSAAREQMRRGFEWCQRTKFAEAAGAFESARAAFESAGGEPEIYFDDYWIGYAYHQSARSEEALAVFRRLIRACEQKGYKWLLAQALNSSANVQSVLKNYSQGIAETEQSLALSEQVGDTYTVQKNLAQQADKYRRLRNHPQMLRYIARCLDQFDAAWPGARQTWRNYVSAANTFQELGLYAVALVYGEESLRLSVREEDPSTIYVSLTTLGQIYGQLHDHQRAVEYARQGLATGQKLSGTREGQKVMAYCLLQLGHLYLQGGDFASAVESYEQAINIYHDLDFPPFIYEAHKGKLLCHAALGDDAACRLELQTALRLIEENRKKIREEQNRNDYYDAEQGVYDFAVDFAHAKSGDGEQAFEYSEASRARSLFDLMRRPPHQPPGDTEQLTVAAVSQPLTLAEIQQRMPPGTQILQYTILPDKVLIWLVWKDGFQTREVRVADKELGRLVRGYLNLISSPRDGSEAEALDAAKALYKILITPVEPLLGGEKVLCVVPDKVLNHLSFDSLVSPDSGRYLIADLQVVYAPSSSVFVVASEALRDKEAPVTESVLSVGVTAFDRDVFWWLPDLPAAATEVRRIREIYGAGSLLLLDAAATKEAVLRGMREADVVHLASHYVIDETSPTSSRLLLAKGDAGGVLTVYDLYRMRLLRTRLVVLAACQTGTERYYKGEGMTGMSRAFIAAGVPTVVASNWPVDSDATAELMVNFHRYRKRDKLPTAAALRRAQLDMLNQPGGRYQHPYYWAAFVTIGGYAQS